MAESSFILEYIFSIYAFCLVIYISFLSKKEYSLPVFSSSTNNYSQIILIFTPISLIFLDNVAYVSLSCCFLKDYFSTFFQVLVLFCSLLTIIASKKYLSLRYCFQSEYDFLIMLAILGLLLLCTTSNLLVVYLVIELQSLVFYTLTSFQNNSEFSGEAGLKYFILGSFSSGFLLFGFSQIYLFTSSWSFENIQRLTYIFNDVPPFFWGILLLSVALFFKQGAAPFHLWLCDVYEGSMLSVTMFFVLVPKSAIFCLITKLFFITLSFYYNFWSNLCFFCGFSSILIGNISALYQKKLKRLIAFSAITHTGFILLAFCCFSIISIKSFSFYFIMYIMMNAALFCVIITSFYKQDFLKYLINWSNLSKRNIIITLIFSIILFSTAGIPPLSGFYSKFLVFISLLQQNWIIVTALLTLISCVGCYFYIRLIKTFFFMNKNNNIWMSLKKEPTEIILSSSFLFISFYLVFPNTVILLTEFLSLSIL